MLFSLTNEETGSGQNPQYYSPTSYTLIWFLNLTAKDRHSLSLLPFWLPLCSLSPITSFLYNCSHLPTDLQLAPKLSFLSGQKYSLDTRQVTPPYSKPFEYTQATIKIIQTGKLLNMYLSWFWGWKYEIMVLQDSVSGENPLPLSVTSHARRSEGALRGLFYKITNPITMAPVSWPHHFPKSILTVSPWGLGFNVWIWGVGTNLQTIALPRGKA